MGSDCGQVVSVYDQVQLSLSPFVPSGLESFSVVVWWWYLILQWLQLLYELATVCSHWLSWDIRGAAKPLCDTGWLWPRGPGLSLSVTFQYKLKQLCWQPGKVSLRFLCASYNLHHLKWLTTFQCFIINRDTFKGLWLFFPLVLPMLTVTLSAFKFAFWIFEEEHGFKQPKRKIKPSF